MIFSPGSCLLRACCLLATMALTVSCGEQTDLEQPAVTDGEIVVVDREVKMEVLPMTVAGSPQTRTAAAQPRRFESLGVVYGDKAVTREGVDPSADESTIKNAYILQFDGTGSNAVLRTKKALTAAQIAGTTPITCSFNMKYGVLNRVYIVANCENQMASLVVGTATIASTFRDPGAWPMQLPTTSAPVGGFPMSAYQDVSASGILSIFRLKHRLAKVVARTNKVATLKLKNIPMQYMISSEQDDPSNTFPLTFTEATLTAGVPVYVPYFFGGYNNDLLEHSTRCEYLAPSHYAASGVKGGMLVTVTTGSSAVYNIYLGDGTPQDFNVEPGHLYDVTANIYGTDSYDLRVGAGITANKLTDWNAGNKYANCYIITSPGVWYQFDTTVMGNNATTLLPQDLSPMSVASTIVPSKLNPVGADVLWETKNLNEGLEVNSVIRIHALRNKVLVYPVDVGNAVVAARDAEGNIIWSWHIWFPEDDPTGDCVILGTANGLFSEGQVTMMKTNLGATVYTEGLYNQGCMGLLYQWGRKDPFPGGIYDYRIHDYDQIDTTLDGKFVGPANAVSVATSIANPTTAYGAEGSDWADRNDNLWGCPFTSLLVASGNQIYNANRGSKTIYDPCPIGWRVPFDHVYDVVRHYGSYDMFETEQRGYQINLVSASSYPSDFPAAGYIDNGYGWIVAGYVGTIGAYVTASAHPTGAHLASTMVFTETNINPKAGVGRSEGGSVRCIKE